jgi:hypothetical protein
MGNQAVRASGFGGREQIGERSLNGDWSIFLFGSSSHQHSTAEVPIIGLMAQEVCEGAKMCITVDPICGSVIPANQGTSHWRNIW